MRFSLLISLSVWVVGCAHVDRREALAATAWDVMSEQELARAAVAEALGELHQVEAIDAEGVVTAGQAGFHSRDERLAFERRVERLLRSRIYGQGPVLQLVRVECERLHRAGWAAWPADEGATPRACEYGDVAMTVHSLFKKPLLQRAYVDVMLSVIGDEVYAGQVRRKLAQLEQRGIEPYLFIVERWERVEGFRPRG